MWLVGCATVAEVQPPQTHTIAPFADPGSTIAFRSQEPGELETIWTGDSDLVRLTTADYQLFIDVGVEGWVDHSREPGYAAEAIHLLGHDGELLRFRYRYPHTGKQVYRAAIRWEGLPIRVWADALNEPGREAAVVTARTLRWGDDD